MQTIINPDQHSARLAERVRHFPSVLSSKRIIVRTSELISGVYARPSVAIIGTRHPSAWGRMSTRWVVSQLAPFGVNIISGGAMGIDACAHWAALEFGLSTQAWVVGPNARPSPRSNHSLFEKLVKISGGALFTPEDLEPRGPVGQLHKSFWIRRNAWLVASADAVIVIEANEKSGTWASAKIAADLGIDVYALPGPSKNPQSAGTNKMISEGYALKLDLKELLTNCLLDAPLESSYNLNSELSRDLRLPRGEGVAESAQVLPEFAEEKLRSPEGMPLGDCFRDSSLAAKIWKLLEEEKLELAGNRIFRRV